MRKNPCSVETRMIWGLALALFAFGNVSAQADEVEVGELITVVSPEYFSYDYPPGETPPSPPFPSDPLNMQGFYNPTAIHVGDELLLFVQAFGNPTLHDGIMPWDFCPGDSVILFRTPWSFEGLRQPYTVVGRVSPCECPDTSVCTAWGHGVGSVLKSDHDQNYYMFIDRSQGLGDIVAGDFIDIIAQRSQNGRDWIPAADINPLVTQTALSGTLGSGSETFISFVDATLIADQGRWWGFFYWYKSDLANPANNAEGQGMMQVLMAPCVSGGRDVCVQIRSGGQWKTVNEDGTFNFVPDKLPPDSKSSPLRVNAIEKLGGYNYRIWSSQALGMSNIVDGCEDNTEVYPNPGSSLVFSTFNGDLTSGLEDGFVGTTLLKSRLRPNPTFNLFGRLRPTLIVDDDGNRVMLSASVDKACENAAAVGWPWGDEVKRYHYGSEIVLTYLSDSVMVDRFNVTSSRPSSQGLSGTYVEIGNNPTDGTPIPWTADVGLEMGNGFVVDSGVGTDQNLVAMVPFNAVGSFPDEPVIEIEANVNVRDTDWIGLGLSVSNSYSLHNDGQIWAQLRPLSSDNWLVRADGNNYELGRGTASAFDSNGFNNFKLLYDRERTEVALAINDTYVLRTFLTDTVTSFNPVILYAGFQVRRTSPSVGAANAGVDDFRVTVYPEWPLVYMDGFESGDTSMWSSIEPPQY